MEQYKHLACKTAAATSSKNFANWVPHKKMGVPHCADASSSFQGKPQTVNFHAPSPGSGMPAPFVCNRMLGRHFRSSQSIHCDSQCCHSLLSLSYCHSLLSLSTLTLYCDSPTVTLYCHYLLSLSTVTLYCYSLLSLPAVTLLLSLSTVTLYWPSCPVLAGGPSQGPPQCPWAGRTEGCYGECGTVPSAIGYLMDRYRDQGAPLSVLSCR